jgi:hypothetical protein
MRILKYVFAAVVFFSVMLCAQDDPIKNEPGYFDFGDFKSISKTDEGTEVNIQEHLIKMVAKMSEEKDKQLAEMLNGIKLIKVNTFPVTNKNRNLITKKIESVQSALSRNNWDNIVRIKQKGENINVSLKTDKNRKITGLVVAGIADKEQAVFVNIVGNIDLETLGKLGDNFNIPSLHGFNKKGK